MFHLKPCSKSRCDDKLIVNVKIEMEGKWLHPEEVNRLDWQLNLVNMSQAKNYNHPLCQQNTPTSSLLTSLQYHCGVRSTGRILLFYPKCPVPLLTQYTMSLSHFQQFLFAHLLNKQLYYNFYYARIDLATKRR